MNSTPKPLENFLLQAEPLDGSPIAQPVQLELKKPVERTFTRKANALIRKHGGKPKC